MKRILVAIIVGIAMIIPVSLPVITFPATAYAACDGNFMGMPPWYRNLTEGGNCDIAPPGQDETGIARFVGTILLNLLQAALVLSGYVALFFILKGGFLYITSAGASDKMAGAKKTLTNAIIGLLICVTSAMIVNAISAALAG